MFHLRKDLYVGKDPFEPVVSNTLNFGQKQSHCGAYLARDEAPIIYKKHHPDVDTVEIEKVTKIIHESIADDLNNYVTIKEDEKNLREQNGINQKNI